MEKIKTYKFLILEDNPSDARLIRRELEKNWEDALIKVICTPNDLRTALKEIVWDVIISDYSMPQFTGYDALRITNESDQNPLFFLMSGVIGEEIAAEAMELGARDYIDKNYPKRMVISIRKALAEAEDSKELQVTRKQLLKSEKKYRDIIDMAPVGYFQVTPDGSFLEVNNALTNMLGYSSIEDLMGKINLIDLFASKAMKEIYRKILKNTKLKFSESKEVVLSKKDGTLQWVILTMQAVTDTETNTQYFNGFLVNISQQKEAESKMYESLTRWQDTFNAITNVIMLVSKDFDIIEINDAGCQLLKMDHDDIIGKKCYKLLHKTENNPDFCPAVKASISKKMESIELKIDNTYYILTAWPILDEFGNILAYSHAIQDITQRKKATEQLVESKRYIESINNLNPDLLYIYDLKSGTAVYANRILEKMLGYTLAFLNDQEVSPRRFLTHPDDYHKYKSEIMPIYNIPEYNEVISYKTRIHNSKNEWLWVDCRETVIQRDEDGSAIRIFGIVRDITSRINAEIEIEKYRDHLEELVESRTKQLQKTNDELNKKNIDLENMQKLYIGREDRIKDLRGQIKELKLQLEKFRNKS